MTAAEKLHRERQRTRAQRPNEVLAAKAAREAGRAEGEQKALGALFMRSLAAAERAEKRR